MTIISAPLTKSELPVVDVGNVKMMIRLSCILVGCSEVDLVVNEDEDAFNRRACGVRLVHDLRVTLRQVESS